MKNGFVRALGTVSATLGVAALGAGVGAGVGCGLDVTGVTIAAEGEDTGVPYLPEGGSLDGDIPPPGDGGSDAETDALVEDADAAIVVPAFAHLPPGTFETGAPDVTVPVNTTYVIDTSAGTINRNDGAGPVASPLLKLSGNSVAVWSVGALSVQGSLDVIGTRGLIVVARSAISIDGTVNAAATMSAAGPGGGSPALGGGAGITGTAAGDERGGGGGGGHGQIGGLGGTRNAGTGGAGGAAYNVTGVNFVGGSGGGHGGDYDAAKCSAHGRGAFGGGAIQFSSITSIAVGAAGVIDVRGGGGLGGCAENSDVTGGGGGGGGGFVYFEAMNALTFAGLIDARGGSGGEGGGNTSNGVDGALASGAATTAAPGGSGTNGGNGGNGGVTATNPTAGAGTGKTGGGGGGAVGRVFFRTHAFDPALNGTVAAISATTKDL